MSNTLNLGTDGNWGVKKDSLLGYNSENGNFKPLAFNFTRASSATVVNKDGLIETVGSGIPRIDFSNDAKGALLLEPQRSNKLSWSNKFTNWSPTNVILTENSIVSPDGTTNATKITDNTTFGNHRVITSTTTSSSGNATYSIFLKKGTMTTCFINFFSNGTIGNTQVDLENGTISGGTGVSQSIEPYGNGWYRVSITGVLATTSSFVYMYMKQIGGYIGNGDYMFMYGAQLEQGSYATSYIPNYGNSAGATRSADVSSQTVPSGIIGQTEGTVFLDVDFKTLSGTNMFVSIRPDASNKIEIYRTDAAIYGEFASDASFNFNKPSVTVGRYKIAVAYSSGSSAMYINGVLIGSNTTPFAFTSTLDGIYINSRGTTFIEQSSYNDVKLYNTRLSNAELQALTSN